MQRRYVRVWSTDESDFTMPLAEFVAEMQAVLEQEGGDAGLEFRMELERGRYDDPPAVDMWVQRPETDAEMAARKAEEAETKRLTAEYETARKRAEYERLKAMFEGLKP